MTDVIENAITGLEFCTNRSQDGCRMLCPYKDDQDETYPGLCEHILKQDALEALKKQPKWIPISEGLPEVSPNTRKHIIIWDGGYNPYPVTYAWRKIRGKIVKRWEFEDGRIYNGRPIVAWMPMPEPPRR